MVRVESAHFAPPRHIFCEKPGAAEDGEHLWAAVGIFARNLEKLSKSPPLPFPSSSSNKNA